MGDRQPTKTNLNIYLGGRIKKYDWRFDEVDGLRAEFSEDDYELPDEWPILKNSIRGKHHYVGPFFYNLNHTFTHGISLDGEEETWPNYKSYYNTHVIRMEKVFNLNNDAIHFTDLFFAWIDDYEAFGTVAEIVKAKESGAFVAIALSHELYKWAIDCDYGDIENEDFLISNNEYWYVCQYADDVLYNCDSVTNALDIAIQKAIKAQFPFKRIVSKYTGKCRGCQKPIEVGSEIYWCVKYDFQGVYCLGCREKVKNIGYILK